MANTRPVPLPKERWRQTFSIMRNHSAKNHFAREPRKEQNPETLVAFALEGVLDVKMQYFFVKMLLVTICRLLTDRLSSIAVKP